MIVSVSDDWYAHTRYVNLDFSSDIYSSMNLASTLGWKGQIFELFIAEYRLRTDGNGWSLIGIIFGDFFWLHADAFMARSYWQMRKKTFCQVDLRFENYFW